MRWRRTCQAGLSLWQGEGEDGCVQCTLLALYKSVFVTGKPVMLVGRLQEILRGAGVVEDC